MKLVTFYIPVKNGLHWIGDALESILNQSSPSINIFVYDDASDDGTYEFLIENYSDKVTLFHSSASHGPAYASNFMIDQISTPYAARLDSDDLCAFDRVQRQYIYLVQNNLDYCGSFIEEFGGASRKVNYPTDQESINFAIISNPPFAHSTLFCKTEILKAFKYNQDCYYCDDYELLFRVACDASLSGGVIPKYLVKYRIHESQITNLFKFKQLTNANAIRRLNFNSLLINRFNIDINYSKNYSTIFLLFKLIKNNILKGKKINKYLIKSIFSLSKQYIKRWTLGYRAR
jgi:glycosyltransferase involved in cell wall biosynthesis